MRISDIAGSRTEIGKIDLLHHIDGSICHLLAPKKLTKRFACSPQLHFTRINTVLGKNIQYFGFRSTAGYIFNRTRIQIFPDSLPISFGKTFTQMYFANHGRQHMRSLQVKIIIRAIQVGRHYCDIVSSVLQVITLTHLDPGYLSYRVGFIRIFEWRSEQAILRHRLRSLTGIDAGASQE